MSKSAKRCGSELKGNPSGVSGCCGGVGGCVSDMCTNWVYISPLWGAEGDDRDRSGPHGDGRPISCNGKNRWDGCYPRVCDDCNISIEQCCSNGWGTAGCPCCDSCH